MWPDGSILVEAAFDDTQITTDSAKPLIEAGLRAAARAWGGGGVIGMAGDVLVGVGISGEPISYTPVRISGPDLADEANTLRVLAAVQHQLG